MRVSIMQQLMKMPTAICYEGSRILKINPRAVAEVIDEYKGYNYMVTFMDSGNRCGYVCLASDHPYVKWHMKQDSSMYDHDFDVHGGVTFFSYPVDIIVSQAANLIKNAEGEVDNDEMWIGFDCAHFNDGKDMEAFVKYFPNFAEVHSNGPLFDIITEMMDAVKGRIGFEQKVWTKEDVVNECKKLIDMIIEWEKEHGKADMA